MNHYERYRLLSEGRGGEFRNLVLSMTNDPRDFPGRSHLKAQLEEIYPGAEHAALRESAFAKLIEFAEARAGGADLLELRGIADNYVVKVESDLAEADRVLPTIQEEELDAETISEAAAQATLMDSPRFRPLVGEQINQAIYQPARG